ncbi:hypothetical protein SPRG_04359 [Saprolegnia parasitica CBS 223.65]|uniref:Uncharacterized protein n=1 Tax=Saprolegnia parasitica (strain CBS 223.65) TaxID=695850 RepID=A0A067CUI1_SAPPC|nr:hypothetical protein SPRG_04359 [Saprolegnia parasitica CBS 223.65]KDO30457.1 hypothetical protein SPRG_04359 [Saprolegnia parasitica CBS 223.65]|eukprot:XP_012198679.1 hypothetical protein SPRG_04359 [Saprolegnia parasitica CBS 223.65]
MDVWEGCKEAKTMGEPYHPVVLQRVSALLPPPSPVLAPMDPIDDANDEPAPLEKLDLDAPAVVVGKDRSLTKPKRFKKDTGSAQWMAVALGVCVVGLGVGINWLSKKR